MKTLIGVITHSKHRFCLDEFQESIQKQTIPADHLFVVNNGEKAYVTLLKSRNLNAVENPKAGKTRIENIVSGRNYIRDYALKNGYDYVFFIDSDVIVPPGALYVLQSLKTDVATGVYLNGFELGGKVVIAPMLFKDLGGGNCQLYTYEGVAFPQVFEIGAAGLGCTLASKKVLEKVEFRTFKPDSSGGEDMAFYVDARAKGFKAMVHTGVKCVHRTVPKDDPQARLFEWTKNVEKGPVYDLDLSKK